MRHSVIGTFLQAGPSELRWAGTGLAVVLAAVWEAATGVLAALMVVLFLVDLVLGVFRAIHVGGLTAFCRDRFGRAFLKLGAAMCGVVLAASTDLTMQHLGVTDDATLVTAGILGAICFGFATSAAESLSHFFPQVQTWLDAALRKIRPVGETPQRRVGDENGGTS